MKNKNFHLGLVGSLLLIVSLSGAVNAAPPAVNSRAGEIKSAQPANLAAKPLQQPLQMQQGMISPTCTALIPLVTQSNELVDTTMKNDFKIGQAWDVSVSFIGVPDMYKGYPHNAMKCCSSQQSFSVQDQQTAGCTNTDTVPQCMEKLVRQCLKPVSFLNKDRLKQSKQKADAIAADAKKLSDNLNMMINILP
jgi:hypothetical protein